MLKFHESEYAKKYRPYFVTPLDTILIFVPLKTPTGRWSKYYGTLKMMEERKDKQKLLNEFLNGYLPKVFYKELQRGYQLTEPLLYAGNWWED